MTLFGCPDNSAQDNSARTIRRGQFGGDNSALDNSAQQFVADNSAQTIILILYKIQLSLSDIFSSIQPPFQQYIFINIASISPTFVINPASISAVFFINPAYISPIFFSSISLPFQQSSFYESISAISFSSIPLPFQQALFINS